MTGKSHCSQECFNVVVVIYIVNFILLCEAELQIICLLISWLVFLQLVPEHVVLTPEEKKDILDR